MTIQASGDVFYCPLCHRVITIGPYGAETRCLHQFETVRKKDGTIAVSFTERAG